MYGGTLKPLKGAEHWTGRHPITDAIRATREQGKPLPRKNNNKKEKKGKRFVAALKDDGESVGETR